MTSDALPSRRSLLGATAAAGTAGALASCAPSGNEGQAGGGSAAPPAPVPSGGTPVRVGRVSDVPVGGSASGEASGQKVLIHRPDEETVLAYSAICTHKGCTVAPVQAEFACPCHGSRFSVANGTVLDGPAAEPLPRLAAAIDGEWITVAARPGS
ncbi:QcrA and Rieske domain-containing protein [Arthrobacter mobilis]|nr:Rieske (2Fe-2S) protein [Arthrobacter mobilis]